ADQPYKEFKIVTLYDDRCVHRLVSITRGDCVQAGRLMRRDAGRGGLGQGDGKGGGGGGSAGSRKQSHSQNITLDALGLDFYHLSENVHKARRAVFGEENPKDAQAPGNAWAAGLLHTAKHESYPVLEEQLRQWQQSLAGAGQKAAEQLLNYVRER